MKLKNFILTLIENNLIKLFTFIIMSLIGVSYYIADQQYQTKYFTQQLIQQHDTMQAYIDAKNKEINMRVDYLNSELNKTNENIVILGQRLDSNMLQIVNMNREINSRLDKFLLLMASSKK